MESSAISSFTGSYRFLSNFYPSPVVLDLDSPVVYPTVEHAYQAAKTEIPERQLEIRLAETAGVAKRLGKVVPLRPHWNALRIGVMGFLLRQKFFPRSPLGEQLLHTGDAYLVEENSWGDIFWGVCKGRGENHLGKLLMQIRMHLQKRKPGEHWELGPSIVQQSLLLKTQGTGE